MALPPPQWRNPLLNPDFRPANVSPLSWLLPFSCHPSAKREDLLLLSILTVPD
jgi:hypothetical protein